LPKSIRCWSGNIGREDRTISIATWLSRTDWDGRLKGFFNL
jgi:hypothetical protein